METLLKTVLLTVAMLALAACATRGPALPAGSEPPLQRQAGEKTASAKEIASLAECDRTMQPMSGRMKVKLSPPQVTRHPAWGPVWRSRYDTVVEGQRFVTTVACARRAARGEPGFVFVVGPPIARAPGG